jgi:hypothetical protein
MRNVGLIARVGRGPAGILVLSFAAVLSASFPPSAFSGPINARYTWMLPKTVIDATIVYSFVSCGPPKDPNNKNPWELQLKITPTLVPKILPDTLVGLKSINPALLKSFWQDKNITLKTFGSSHILGLIASAPVNQVGQIAANVLAGVGKIAAVSFGVPATADIPKDAKLGCGTAQADREKIIAAQNKIKELQAAMADPNLGAPSTPGGPSKYADISKEYTAEIQTLQSSIVALEAGLTLTVQKTIDPGFSPIDILGNDAPSSRPRPILPDGRVATFALPDGQLTKTNWFADIHTLEPADRHSTDVNVYLDFRKARPRIAGSRGVLPTPVGPGSQFREVAYIPLLVYQGTIPAPPSPARSRSRAASTETAHAGKLLNDAGQTMVFGQFGIARSLPLSAGLFENLNWSVTFAENGEVTDASFASKSLGVVLTSLFSNTASTVNSVVSEQRAAASAPSSETVRLTTENTALQAKINNIQYNQTLQGLIAKGLAPQ